MPDSEFAKRLAALSTRNSNNRLDDSEWAEIEKAVKRGVPLAAIYSLVKDEYTTYGGFNSAFRWRFRKTIREIRGKGGMGR